MLIDKERIELLDIGSKFALFSVSGMRDEQFIKIANLHEN